MHNERNTKDRKDMQGTHRRTEFHDDNDILQPTVSLETPSFLVIVVGHVEVLRKLQGQCLSK